MSVWKTVTAALLLSCALFLPACAQTGSTSSSASSTQEETPETITEGSDTAVSVSYAPYAGTHADLFLKEGDRIAVIAPSAIPSKEQVDATMEGLKSWGYVPVAGEHVYDQETTVDNIQKDLTWALEDNTIKAIFCVRGGYGATEVMDAMSLDLISSAKKLIIGYSDISVYHAAWRSAGLPSLHACMAATFGDDFPAECAEAEQKILRGEIPSYTCEGNKHNKAGEAEGVLIGGNLSTFVATLNTAYDCTQANEPYILFLEEIAENRAHIHRLLTILKNMGVLDNAVGIVFGEWADVPKHEGFNGNARGGAFESVADMIDRQILADINIPVAFGFPAGHGKNNYPLLMGEIAKLSVSADKFTLSWK
ncbi:MAG: LD-carboxypeptidase [Coriobacteriales bacterium]|nr:LD-carboxypeptidase [Coriobacteriales bacterium]